MRMLGGGRVFGKILSIHSRTVQQDQIKEYDIFDELIDRWAIETARWVSACLVMRITAKTTYELVLNQGGKDVVVGDVFEVYRGIFDVSNSQMLGEEMIARIRVTRVTPETSYAVVVEGTPLENIEVGAVVRRSNASGRMAVPAGASPTTVLHGGTDTPSPKK